MNINIPGTRDNHIRLDCNTTVRHDSKAREVRPGYRERERHCDLSIAQYSAPYSRAQEGRAAAERSSNIALLCCYLCAVVSVCLRIGKRDRLASVDYAHRITNAGPTQHWGGR